MKIVSDHNSAFISFSICHNCIQGLQSLFFSYYPPSYKFLSLFARGVLLVQGKGRKWSKIIIGLPEILENPYQMY